MDNLPRAAIHAGNQTPLESIHSMHVWATFLAGKLAGGASVDNGRLRKCTISSPSRLSFSPLLNNAVCGRIRWLMDHLNSISLSTSIPAYIVTYISFNLKYIYFYMILPLYCNVKYDIYYLINFSNFKIKKVVVSSVSNTCWFMIFIWFDILHPY